MLRNIPAELLLHIVQFLPSIRDKCQLMQTSVTRLDVSGCWNISETLIETLCRSLSHLNDLCLNGYRLHNHLPFQPTSSHATFEQLRDHVYQVRPSHDLSSMTMDLSKDSSYQLKIPFILLVKMISNLPYLESLSIQYQDISLNSNKRHRYDAAFSAFRNIQHLDISSCIISHIALHSLLNAVGSNLISLKMLNMDLDYLSCLTITQRCRRIKCLHVSCNNPSMIPMIRQVVSMLPNLEDFRLTRIRTGEIDSLIDFLKPDRLKRLDLSPKMNIYPRPPPSFMTFFQVNDQLNNEHNLLSNYATIEHDLLFSDRSLQHLSNCYQLVELRICFPIISHTALHSLFRSLPQLEIFELRQQKEQQHDFLTGLKFCRKLKELYLFSVTVSQERIIEWISNNCELGSTLKHAIISDSGFAMETNLAHFLSHMRVLRSLCVGPLMEPATTLKSLPLVNNDSMDLNNAHNVTLIRQKDKWCIQ
ncbi:MAG: hypothetical protein EXX96DRAFT_564182 [Benjaminiella poitrasii]|nr:MAG: hypothetical protein EXX96DRAFT_564182 [Benjaminiella poitrasii]